MNKGKELHLKFGFRSNEREEYFISPKVFLGTPSIRAGISTKMNEVKSVQQRFHRVIGLNKNRVRLNASQKRFLSRLDIDEHDLAIPLQCHSNIVRRVESPGIYEACDALITNVKEIALMVSVADCVPILLFDPLQRAIGVIHAGWRGTVAAITRKTIEMMVSEYRTKPENLLIFVGPAAGVCCYEVGEEVAQMFRNDVIVRKGGKTYIDLKKENGSQLCHMGVKEDNIEKNEYCTICESTLFYSYRREGRKTGRMLAIICIKS